MYVLLLNLRQTLQCSTPCMFPNLNLKLHVLKLTHFRNLSIVFLPS
jgi:hypothetical protein